MRMVHTNERRQTVTTKQLEHFARPTVDNGRGMKAPNMVSICRVCHKAIEKTDAVTASPWRHVRGAARPPMTRKARVA